MLSVVRRSYYHRGEYRETVRGRLLVTAWSQGARLYCCVVASSNTVVSIG